MMTPLARDYIKTWAHTLELDFIIEDGDEVVFSNSAFALYYDDGQWTVSKAVTVHGAVRTLNDPGDPDTIDIVEIQSFKKLKEALTCLGFHFIMEAIEVTDECVQDEIATDEEP